MENSLFYFTLGSLFTFGSFHPGNYPLLHVVSSISLLMFIYSKSSAKNTCLQIKIVRKNDLLVLLCGLVLESILVSTSMACLRTRLFKVVAALGLSVSVAAFCVILNYIAERGISEKNVPMDGPYRYIRHPIYASLILYWLSCCVYLSCFISMGIFLWFTRARIFPRIVEHEKEIVAASPEYSEYKRNVWSGILMYR